MNTHASRLEALRLAMANDGLDAVIMTNSDPHRSEYLPAHWQQVRWLTGFTGEVATVVVTPSEAALWTDSRFFLTGAMELDGSGVALMRLGVEGTPTVATWLAAHGVRRIGLDRRLMTRSEVDGLAAAVDGLEIADCRPLDALWTDRPELPSSPIEVYPEELAGESAASKLRRVRDAVFATADRRPLLLTALDDVAWVLNLRGADVECTPVFIAYLEIGAADATLYINEERLTSDVRRHLADLGVAVRPYAVRPEVDEPTDNPVPLMRAIKNATELDGTRQAMARDGVVMTRFWRWVEQQTGSTDAHAITECDCARRLADLRRQMPLYRDESFPAIVAWQAHAAMPHYMPTAASDVAIRGNGLLLVDTGGQYLDGTTDITRTVAIGTPSAEERRDYTLVLKGHIRLATARFPRGTRGDQLDALARLDLWRDGKTYLHGTGHGVGHYLAVHEGPQSIRLQHNPQPLVVGMVTSNEPAYYAAGSHGVRHENCVAVHEAEGMAGFLEFETLTLCYIDTRPIVVELLTADERAWLNSYNRRVADTLAPLLTADERAWLNKKTRPI